MARYPKLRFGPTVLCQLNRSPALVAKEAAVLQLLSGGRLILGIGAGWKENESHAYGYNFQRAKVRLDQLEEAVQIIRKMWSEDSPTFHGQYYSIDSAYCFPRPDPVPPLLIGGFGPKRTLKIVAKYADWCNIYDSDLEFCRERLAPLGIGVYQSYDDKPLPFEDNVFDIVINRHETYDTFEVARVLKSGGYFITQQVGCENNRALTERLRPGQAPLFPDFNLMAELPKFMSAGFEIEWSDEALTPVRYLDVGAIVYYAKVIEWEYPNFSVENDFPQLCALYEEWLLKGYIESSEHRFIIVARNKK
jgi:SAM-dependent methyltransferase